MRWEAFGAAALVVGCAGSSAPKAFKPTLEERVTASPSTVFQAAVKAVSDEGLPLREADPAGRVIQTDYVDMQTFDPLGASQYPASERLVRFRILIAANQEAAGSVIAIFGIYAPFRTGYSTSERNERAIPRDHPGMQLVRDLWADIQKSVGQQ